MEHVYPNDGDLAERLRRLVKAEPWIAMALIMMMTPDQWKALRSQSVFESMRKRVERAAAARRGQSAFVESPADVAQSVLSRLVQTDWLKRFIVSKGSATGYLNGATHFQTRDVIRSLLRQKNRRLAQLPEGLLDATHGTAASEIEQKDFMSRVKKLVSALPQDVREALCDKYPVLNDDGRQRTNSGRRADRALCEKGITMLREMLASSTE